MNSFDRIWTVSFRWVYNPFNWQEEKEAKNGSDN